MRSSTNAREGGTLPPATRSNTSPIIMQWGYVKTVRSISCKKKITTNGQHYSALNKNCKLPRSIMKQNLSNLNIKIIFVCRVLSYKKEMSLTMIFSYFSGNVD